MERKDLNASVKQRLEIVKQDLSQVLNIATNAMFGSEIEKKTQQLVVQMKDVLKQVQNKELPKHALNNFVKNVQSLAHSIKIDKAKNPLVSSELVDRITQLAANSVKIKNSLEKEKSN